MAEERFIDNSDRSSIEKPLADRQLTAVKASKLYKEIERGQLPIVYHPVYNISFCGIERCHPFDSRKWGRVYETLLQSGMFEENQTIRPLEASMDDLRVVHSSTYLSSLCCPCYVAKMVEVTPVALIPPCGTILAAKLALTSGWAINIGGGFHHASRSKGGGFCIYADITLALTFLFSNQLISKAMIVDLDAHQGNGHENDFSGDSRVYILDMFNSRIYPHDLRARRAIRRSIHLHVGTQDSEYLSLLSNNLEDVLNEFQPDIIVYNAGTDCLQGDPLGLLSISSKGIRKRDEIVFKMARDRHIPVVMLLSGGYMPNTHEVIAKSILNLYDKNLLRIEL
ncbi:histone deacetylase 11, putative [Brugia malayi]|uniref:Histone deacetylase 11 n=1 Tax=Brugia malayi TaxID=6279 RepID=A0A0I9N8H4_BRUMA|nr:histone deacetylase 11, putative [Brugia malayi]CTP81445.1 BMA-HDAC-11 [Brugia malayi]VIO98146.1 histone deacetylase 11, putative [Brugia malayi]